MSTTLTLTPEPEWAGKTQIRAREGLVEDRPLNLKGSRGDGDVTGDDVGHGRG